MLATGAAALTVAAQAQAQAPTLYAVIFAITATGDGRDVAEFKVAKVMDPRSGTTDPVDVPVSQDYVAKARAMVVKKLRAAGGAADSKTFYTYFFLDPSRPGEVLTGADKPAP